MNALNTPIVGPDTVTPMVPPAQLRGRYDRQYMEQLSRGEVIDWRVNPRSYEFIGTVFDPLTPIQTLQRAKWMTTGHSFRYIVTPNVDHLVRLASDPEFYRPLYEASWLSVCDSRILEGLAQLSGLPLYAVPGSDLSQQLFDNVITAQDEITVIGADREIVNRVKARYGLTKVSHHIPPMGLRNKPEAIAECARFVAENPARYVFICVGSPQQELVAKACLDRGDCVGLGLCVGASLDFIGGRVSRAPKWMQESRLEWLYRLGAEPRRLWKRYLVVGPKIFWLWLKWSLTSRKAMKQSLG
ncbi:glycosyl transferase [Algimonas ampicilliniresistens]|uniref:Glycosyl transferase n=1 Tax=Algimonas ampicilliniresistens TaxID=1298735 RepID=A0ABQ5V6V2_9PROT|nr:WecB/TagA/CpsF family glycosyltransferase [Algimonas ampicilliniresistens]GLQ22583.1 glycosyl transferase [Algimonas ampicilliniresistens]